MSEASAYPQRMANDWHPILAAVEGPAGAWRMVDPQGREYGTIEIRRVSDGAAVRYRCTVGGDVIGWASTLREGAYRVHAAFLASHGPGGGPIAHWGELGRETES